MHRLLTLCSVIYVWVVHSFKLSHSHLGSQSKLSFCSVYWLLASIISYASGWARVVFRKERGKKGIDGLNQEKCLNKAEKISSAMCTKRNLSMHSQFVTSLVWGLVSDMLRSALQYPVCCISQVTTHCSRPLGDETVWLMVCGTEDKPKKALSFTELKRVILVEFEMLPESFCNSDCAKPKSQA